MLIANGKNLETLQAEIQHTLDEITEQYQELGLKYSSAKCKAMLTTGKHGAKEPLIKINENPIEYTKEFTYLGVTISNTLLWECHQRTIRTQIIRKLHSARVLLYNDKGLQTQTSSWIHDAIIIPKAIYGAIVWASHKLSTSERGILDRINRIGLNIRLNTKRSTPTRKLEIITNIAPLDIQAQGGEIKAWGRLRKMLGQTWDGTTTNKVRRP